MLRTEMGYSTILTDKNRGGHRDSNIDLIRVIACAAVVGLHTFPKDLSVYTALLYYLCGFAVPFFFMSSGYFLLNRSKVSCEYAKNRCVGIIKTVFAWSCLWHVLKFVKQGGFNKTIVIDFSSIVKTFAGAFVQRGTLWQFWYLGALLIIYMLLPFLSKLSSRNKRILLLTCGIISISIQIVSFKCGKPIQKYVTQTFRIWTWLFYFLLGGQIKIIKAQISTYISIVSHFWICADYTVIVILFENYVGCKKILEAGEALHAEYFYDSFCEMVWIVIVFSFLLRINLSKRCSKFVMELASLTMGIYIIHPMVLAITIKIIGNNSIFNSILCWFVTTLCATGMAWIIKRFPLGEYLIKI